MPLSPERLEELKALSALIHQHATAAGLVRREYGEGATRQPDLDDSYLLQSSAALSELIAEIEAKDRRIAELDGERRYYVDRYYGLLSTLRDPSKLPPPYVLASLGEAAKWPADYEEGKRLQRELSLDEIPPKTECETGAGLWSRLRAARGRKGTAVMTTGTEDALRVALVEAQRLCREALPKFDWGKSALDANAIRLLNEVPRKIDAALSLPSSGDQRDAVIEAVAPYRDALEWIVKIADANYEQDDKLRSQGARTLIRISDRASDALKSVPADKEKA